MKILKCGAYEAFYDMPLAIDWMLTTRCNYRCTYCFHYKTGSSPPPILPFATLDQLKAAVDNIASLNRPWYDFIFTGGEPTLHPHMIDLIYLLHDALKDRVNDILIITNGSRNKELYEKIAEVAKKVNLSMQISIHTDHVDMTHILELIENLSSDVNIYFNLMFNPAKVEEVRLIYDIMYEYRKMFPFDMGIATIRLHDDLDPRYVPKDFLWQEEAIKKFNDLKQRVKLKVPLPREKKHKFRMFHDIEENGERKIIETKDFNLNLQNGLSIFTGMYCISNVCNLRIEENGDCRGMICYHDINMCNIYERNSIKTVRDKLIHAIQCPRKVCGCPTSNFIPKFSARLEAIRFMEIFNDKQKALFNAYDNFTNDIR